jgi:hypothetical protein
MVWMIAVRWPVVSPPTNSQSVCRSLGEGGFFLPTAVGRMPLKF